jgi:hypothetical protein
MCASAVVLWAFIAGFQSRRVWLKKTLESDRSQEDQWKWYDRLIAFSFLHTLKESWFDLKMSWYLYKRRRNSRR